ncbi:hypothetical protein XBFM1_1200001 [Xenorhabdus bovienii str. feltiae Moldova]|uniref:Uncharacterized protein n=1 Tax=Xenorhabdus bovienii str. feltiae Moldova TaxID=1398200 RepID=A0A077NMK8_XENBV|nr:hypothetical protein XBFM1_1200001 [Xenorhabdus bovienii str. feltiae Moldova]
MIGGRMGVILTNIAAMTVVNISLFIKGEPSWILSTQLTMPLS